MVQTKNQLTLQEFLKLPPGEGDIISYQLSVILLMEKQ